MAKSLRSSAWYRIADLRLRLRPHARIHRQRFRGQIWYVLQDRQGGRFHRLSPPAHQIVALLDGRRTVNAIWEAVGTRFGDEQPTQDEVIRLLAQLHTSDLLVGATPPDMEELTVRADRQNNRDIVQRLRNPLALRFPLLDPDCFLTATLPFVRPLFTVTGFLVWLGVVLAGIVIAAVNWQPLTQNVVDRALTAESLILLALVYPIIKAVHELGHAYATKRWGGEMHEMGIMLLVLMPLPYVDASSAVAFGNKWRRIVVGGAGIMVEMLMAAIAVMVWVSVEPGLARAVAFSVILIGSISTVLFNGNPLLRFDGYYILGDILEIPNLGGRANAYLLYLIQRHAFGMADAKNPVTAPSEAPWLFVYAFAAFFYRFFVMIGIALFISTKLFIVGILLALWTVVNTLVLPAFKGLRYLFSSPDLRQQRSRALSVSAVALAVFLVATTLLPLPYATIAQGVVIVPDDAAVRVASEGDIVQLFVSDSDKVRAGMPLVELTDTVLNGKVAVLETQQNAFQLQLEAVRTNDLVQANIMREQIKRIESELELDRKRLADLTVTADRSGRFFYVVNAADMPGRFARKGDLVGYVLDDGDVTIRVVVPQSEVDLVRHRTKHVDVRLAHAIDQPMPATMLREVPAAVQDLPSLALSTRAGGPITLDPNVSDRIRALDPVFQFDVQLETPKKADLIGERVHIRFDHGIEPIAWRFIRALRQLFLSHFNV